MIIKQDIFLADFNFWSGARYTARQLTNEDFLILEEAFADAYPDGLEDVEVNDIFWFEEDWIAELLGYADFDELVKKRNSIDEDEDEEVIDWTPKNQ